MHLQRGAQAGRDRTGKASASQVSSCLADHCTRDCAGCGDSLMEGWKIERHTRGRRMISVSMALLDWLYRRRFLG
ncbi:hypothetical protein N7U68_00625 (plasmid) [Roseovarius pelagicus]|uniref:Uncharacterized protein n=1 Tax=Roseovarius pelagicus TaxID=2980108 RepID=A0ABY6D5F9_9RHOB|nr:hypothetical protein N7U68_00625 [Roseovarius pelagicus]